MLPILSGLVLLVSSVALQLGPRVANDSVQRGLAIACVFAAILLLFRPHANSISKSNKMREACIGFSALIPVVTTGWLYNSFIAPIFGPDELYGGVYSFLMWGVLAIASIPIWGHVLRFAGIVSLHEARAFRTWRSVKGHSDQNQ